MRACLAKLAVLGALLLAPLSAALGQEQFPGTGYITPFPAGDIYRVQVYGDAFAEGLLGGLVDALADDARVQLQRKRRPLAGISRPEFEDEMRAEEASKDTVHIAVVMVGYNDRYNMRISPREFIPPGSPSWRARVRPAGGPPRQDAEAAGHGDLLGRPADHAATGRQRACAGG